MTPGCVNCVAGTPRRGGRGSTKLAGVQGGEGVSGGGSWSRPPSSRRATVGGWSVKRSTGATCCRAERGGGGGGGGVARLFARHAPLQIESQVTEIPGFAETVQWQTPWS